METKRDGNVEMDAQGEKTWRRIPYLPSLSTAKEEEEHLRIVGGPVYLRVIPGVSCVTLQHIRLTGELLKILMPRDTWLTYLVGWRTLAFGSGHGLRVGE